jgi:hypothetical protein
LNILWIHYRASRNFHRVKMLILEQWRVLSFYLEDKKLHVLFQNVASATSANRARWKNFETFFEMKIENIEKLIGYLFLLKSNFLNLKFDESFKVWNSWFFLIKNSFWIFCEYLHWMNNVISQFRKIWKVLDTLSSQNQKLMQRSISLISNT